MVAVTAKTDMYKVLPPTVPKNAPHYLHNFIPSTVEACQRPNLG